MQDFKNHFLDKFHSFYDIFYNAALYMTGFIEYSKTHKEFVMYLFFGIFILIIFLFFCINFLHKKKLVKKVCTMQQNEKWERLNELLQPFGYEYVPFQDLITSQVDAWQRQFGYHAFFDRAASHANMVIDCLPIYFDYGNRTWLIELWKGQYGINMGCEIGVYYADRILKEEEREHTLFRCVENEDMLKMSFTLFNRGRTVAQLSARHWWLTAFLPGSFSTPFDLSLDASIILQSPAMAAAFTDGLIHTGYSSRKIRQNGSSVTFTFASSSQSNEQNNQRIRMVQGYNRFGCRLYQFITKPFHSTRDRLLYLYLYLPFAFRKMLHMIAFIQSYPKKIERS